MKDPGPPFHASFAFQPIVDIKTSSVFAYEALARGRSNEPAGVIFKSLSKEALHPFDRDARAEAIRLAASLGIASGLSLNFLPQTLDTLPDAVSSTIATAQRCGIALDRIILEVTEGEIIHDHSGFAERLNDFRAQGLKLAIDDFGAGYSGLNLLAEFQPDIVKLDMTLVRDIESKGPRQAIVRAVLQACMDLGIDVIAEGVETEAEFRWFRRRGVALYQGFYFGKPAFEALLPPNGFMETSRISLETSSNRDAAKIPRNSK